MELSREDWEVVALVNREVEHYISLLEDAREREAISVVFNISRLGNQLMQHNTPWKLVKVSYVHSIQHGSGARYVSYTSASWRMPGSGRPSL
jgi:methionyl-tRNA synthetase